MVQTISIIIIIFALFAWSRAFLRFKDKKITISEFSFWSFIWAGVVIVAWNPEVISLVSLKVGIQRPIDLVIYSSVLLLFYLNFRLYVKQDKTDSEITEIVRELSLRKK